MRLLVGYDVLRSVRALRGLGRCASTWHTSHNHALALQVPWTRPKSRKVRESEQEESAKKKEEDSGQDDEDDEDDEEGKCKESRGKPILRNQAEGSQRQVKAPAGGVRTWPQ